MSTEPFFVKELYRARRVGLGTVATVAWPFLFEALGILSDHSAVKKRVCRTLLQDQLEEPCLAWYSQLFETRLRKLMRPDMLRLCEHFHNNGQPVFLLSAALDFMVEPFAKVTNAVDFCGTETLREQGKFTGELGPIIPFEEGKATILRRMATQYGINLQASTACSDSILNLPMLAAVGRPIAAWPSKKLLRHAVTMGWEMMGEAAE